MDDRAILRAACKLLGVKVGDVLSYCVYSDHIALVVKPGPKHKISLSDLQPRPAPRRRKRAGKGAGHEADK